MTLDPLIGLSPGRRAYAMARALRRAKRRHQLKGVVVVPRKPGTVLQFPTNKEEVNHGANPHDQT